MTAASKSPLSSPRRLLGRRRASAGFTLVELVIVGALIALFSGLAVFGVQQQFENNKRKAAVGEARQIGTALDFAYQDIGFFPALCFLDDSRETLQLSSQRAFGGTTLPGGTPAIYAFLHAYAVPPALSNIGGVERNWRGAYFSASQTRTAVSQGQGGAAPMLLPNMQNGIPALGLSGTAPENASFQWPLDPFNNPYVLYMLDLVPDTNPPTLRFAIPNPNDPQNTNSISSTGNFMTAVVSYGRNGVPGGGDLFDSQGDPAQVTDNGPYGLRLFVGDAALPDRMPLRHLSVEELGGPEGRRRANAWSRTFADTAGFLNALPLDNDGGTNFEDRIGITDPESDDIVFSF